MTMTNTDFEPLMRDRDVAQALNLSRSSVWRLALAGKLPQPIRIGQRAARWRKSEIVDYLATAARAYATTSATQTA